MIQSEVTMDDLFKGWHPKAKGAVERQTQQLLLSFCLKNEHQLFSGRSLRTVTAVCHISLSRNAFSSAFSFSR